MYIEAAYWISKIVKIKDFIEIVIMLSAVPFCSFAHGNSIMVSFPYLCFYILKL